MRFLFLILISASAVAAPTNPAEAPQRRARELKDFLAKEKSAYDARESVRASLGEELDDLNAEQNNIRKHVESITEHYKEISMALENTALEHSRQKELEAFEKRRLWLLYKVVYKLKKDGVVRFLFQGKRAKESLTGRMRVLFRTLRSRVHLAKQLEERSRRLKTSELRLEEARQKNQSVMAELKEQEELLVELLKKKKSMLAQINHKQDSYQAAVKEYRKVSKTVAALFKNFETSRDTGGDTLFPKRGSLPMPVELGQIVKNFGKVVNEKFGTVTPFKGIEIETEMNAPVRAVMAGTIEYEGWVKGLGNVVIVHHGGGFYSLSGHLYKALKAQGAQVQEGEILGLVGDTGNSNVPSLYFEIRENTKAVDPAAYFASADLKKFL